MSFVEGDASYLNADADEWTAVDVNAPLVTGDRFYSGPDGRAEIELPGGVYARIAADTEIELLDVSDRAVQVKVGVGTATFRLRSVPAGMHVEVSTPSTALVARSRGVYRVDVAEDGQTTVVVREGEADAFLGDDRYRLEKGRGARIVNAGYVEDGGAPIDVFDATAVQADPWDEWEGARAARYQNVSSARYVDESVYGVQDLDEYGSWDRHETYGPIWRPTQVSAGWAPYTQGRWVWQDPWGWTWVDYQPWGWAPSHYGRWVYVQDAWAWAPGPVVARPAYAPATVGFLGVSVNTPSVSVSVGIGPSVGWVPLGWGEPIVPWWGGVYGAQVGRPWWGGWGGPRIVNNTVYREKNITNINVTNINYTNIDHGFTAVSRDSFVRGDLQRIDVPREQLRQSFRPLRGAPDVIPARESLFAARPEKLRGGRARQPSPEILQRAAVSTRAVPAQRPDFAQKLKLIEREKGAPVAPRQLQQLATAERRQGAPRVQTVASRGKRAVVPEVTAQAPARLNAPLQRQAKERGGPANGAQRDLATREQQQTGDPRAAALGQRTMPAPGADARKGEQPDQRGGRAVRPPEGERQQPGTPAERAEATRGRNVAPSDPRQAAREERAARGAEERAARGAGGRAVPENGQPAAPRAERPQDAARERAADTTREERAARRGAAAEAPRPGREPAAERTQAERLQTERAESERARSVEATRNASQQRQAAEREQAQRVQREGAQREQAERAQRQSAEREQAQRAQRESAEREQVQRAQREGAQREQAQRAERQSAEREQAQRQSVEREQAQRAQRESAQREQAERAQRQSAEREQAQRAQRESAQREQAQRAQRQSAEREQAQRAQREGAQREQAQRAQAERAQRNAAAQQQRQAVQAERARQAGEARQRQAAQQQRQQAQRQQPSAVERQGNAPAQDNDPRSARKEKRQQQRRAMPES